MSRDVALLLLIVVIAVLAGGAFFLFGRGDADQQIVARSTETDDAAAAPAVEARRRGPGPLSASGESRKNSETATSVPDTLTWTGDGVISGIVTGLSNRPVADAVVALCRDVSDLPSQSVQGAVIAQATTGADGAYEFTDVAIGTPFMLRVEHESYSSYFGTRIELSRGEHRRVDVRLQRGLDLSGSVIDDAGMPLDEARVWISDPTKRTALGLQNVEREVVTSADGTFTFHNLTPGFKHVMALKEGYTLGMNTAVHLIPGRKHASVTLKLGRGTFIAGTVVDASGDPIDGVVITVQAMARAARQASLAFPPVATGPDGRFRIDGLRAGRYALTCRKAGYAAQGVRRNVQAGDADVRIEMVRNPTIRGRVVDAATGAPIQRFRLVLNRDETLVFASQRYTQTFEDADGAFEYLCETTNGEFYLFAEADGYASGRSEKLSLGGEPIEDVVIALGKGATVNGTVTDTAGRPVGDARVEVVPQSQAAGDNILAALIQRSMRTATRRGRTDAEGRYQIENVQEGRFVVKVSHPDYAAAESDLPINVPASGEVSAPPVVLLAGGTVRGIVYDAEGNPEARSKIQLVPKGRLGAAGFAGVTDDSGTYVIEHVKPGIYWVSVIERNGKPNPDLLAQLLQGQQRREIMVADGEVVQCDIR